MLNFKSKLGAPLIEAVAIGAAVMASGRLTIKQLRYDYYVASYNPDLEKREAFKILAKGELYPSKTRYFIIEPANFMVNQAKQDEFELMFYYKLPPKEVKTLPIANQEKSAQIQALDLDDENYIAVNLPFPLVLYSPHSKVLLAEYSVDFEGALRLTVKDVESEEYAMLKNIYTGEQIQAVKNLRIVELF
jgi:hypothetical protein